MSAQTQANALLQIIDTIRQMIEAKGSDGIPSGHLYVLLQSKLGQAYDLRAHNRIIELLVEAGKITNRNHLLVAK